MDRNGLKLNRGVKASAIYTVSSFITKGVNIITLPIFTRIMTTEQIGIVTTYNSWVSILNVFACLGLTTGSFSIAMHELKDTRNEYESSILTLTSITAIVISAIYAAAYAKINRLLGLPWLLVVLMLIGFLLHPATDFWMARERFEYKYKLSAFISVFSAIMSSCLAIVVTLLCRRFNNSEVAIYRLYATYFVYDMVAIALYIYIMKEGRVFCNFRYWKYGVKLSIPLMIHALAKHILDVSDKIMIQRLCGNSSAGIYGTLYSLSSLSLILWTAINVSLVPYMFSSLDNKATSKEKINGVILPVLAIYGVFATLLALISPEIVKIIATKEYYEAIYMMPPVAAGIYFISLYSIMGNILLYNKKTSYIMFATIFAAALNVGLNYVFILKFGYMAAAYTTLFCNVILAAGQSLLAKKVHGELPFDGKKVCMLSMVVTAAVLLCNFLYSYNAMRYAIAGLIVFFVIQQRKKWWKYLKRFAER